MHRLPAVYTETHTAVLLPGAEPGAFDVLG